MTDTDDLLDKIEQTTTDDHSPLADDLDRSIEQLAAQIDMEGSGPSPMPIGPEQGIALLRPMIRQKADRDPEAVLRTLAVLHLETGALLGKHSSLDPVDLL